MTNIEWTEETWNPLIGCSRVSEGCRNCYAERQAYRAAAMGISRYDGLIKKVGGEIRWTGKVNLVESALEKPLRWKKSRRIFVNSMSDLFHETVPDEWIDRIFEVMIEAEQHTYQILTKRPERMRDYVAHWLAPALKPEILSHVWLGVSVEDQATADERIPILLQTPAAVRWVSYEPALDPVDFTAIRYADDLAECRWDVLGREHWVENSDSPSAYENDVPGLDWVVVGGESGPDARPFDLAWARQTIAQGRAASVAVFCKQLGARPMPGMLDSWQTWGRREDGSMILCDRKGGDPAEWPADLRVREYPRNKASTTP